MADATTTNFSFVKPEVGASADTWGTISVRFWAKVRKAGPADCWEWTACTNVGGYGAFSVRRGLTMLAPRVSWTLHNGTPPQGLHILHRCDNRLCVNPAHLFLGTIQDNLADMRAKGRGARGKMLPQTVLTEAQVLTVKRRLAKNGSRQRIADNYGVSVWTIHDIAQGRTWKWLSNIEAA